MTYDFSLISYFGNAYFYFPENLSHTVDIDSDIMNRWKLKGYGSL